jgi:hypothetical protein
MGEFTDADQREPITTRTTYDRAAELYGWIADHPDATRAEQVAALRSLGFHSASSFEKRLAPVQP